MLKYRFILSCRSGKYLGKNGLTTPLGCFQRIYFASLFRFPLHMGCHVAVAETPFCGWIRKYEAVFSRRIVRHFLAPFTFVNDNVAGPTAITTAGFFHKGTFLPLFYACANHFIHVLSEILLLLISFESVLFPRNSKLCADLRSRILFLPDNMDMKYSFSRKIWHPSLASFICRFTLFCCVVYNA